MRDTSIKTRWAASGKPETDVEICWRSGKIYIEELAIYKIAYGQTTGEWIDASVARKLPRLNAKGVGTEIEGAEEDRQTHLARLQSEARGDGPLQAGGEGVYGLGEEPNCNSVVGISSLAQE